MTDLLSRHQHVRGALDGVGKGVAAAVLIVVFRLGDGVVHVDCGDLQRPFTHHFVKAVDASSGLFADPVNAIKHGGIGIVNALGEVSAVVQKQVRFRGRRPS